MTAHTACVLKLIASGLVSVSLLAASAAVGAESELVSRGDRHGDVEVHEGSESIDPAVLDSVDLRHVTLTRQRHGVRAVIRLKQVLPARGPWFQQVGLSVAPPSWVAPEWFFFAFATPQHLGAAVALFDEIGDEGDEEDNGDEEVFCRVAASKGEKVVRLLIPDRCLPKESGQLIVSATLLHKRGNGPPVAEDQMTVGRLVDLQPGR